VATVIPEFLQPKFLNKKTNDIQKYRGSLVEVVRD
jgi:hypothetical protein